MFKHEFDEIIREHFDLSDKYTRQYIAALEDGNQEQLIGALSSALYDKIVGKVDKIDFGTIPLSRGDITKVEGFEKTEECLAIMRRLVIEYKQDPSVVDVVISAINNIRDRKALFVKGYLLDIELPMLIYNLMVLSAERSVSFMIATCIQFIKDPESKTPKQALDKVAYKKTMDDVLFKQLITFNNLCTKGEIDKILEASMKRPVKEDVEVMFDVVAPAAEETPIDAADANDSTEFDPFEPDNTVEPFKQDEPSENPTEENDTIPNGTQDFPEELHDDNGDPIDSNEDEIDIEITDDESEDVEPENIPALPGDDVTNSDAPINEFNVGNAAAKAKGLADKATKYYVNNKGKVKTTAITALAVIAVLAKGGAILKTCISSLRNVIYFFYYSKLKFKDFLEIQADLIEANANSLENSTDSDLTEEKKKKVVAKQHKLAERLRNWANKISIDGKKASNEAKKESDKDDKEKKTVGQDEEGDDVLF